jgi:diguanylate cyclase (GGDEF)-like protein
MLDIDDIPAPVAVLDPTGVVISANDPAVAITGGDHRALCIGASLVALAAEHEREALASSLEAPAVERLAFRLRSDLGARMIEVSVRRLADGDMIAVMRDATELVAARSEAERLESELRHSATHDALTGLANRALLLDRLDQYTARNLRFNYQFALLFFDLDGFKSVNDRDGHEAGDAVLRAVGTRLAHLAQGAGMAARLGGDEFVVVLDGCRDRDQLGLFAARCIEEIVRPVPYDGKDLVTGISIGIALPQTGRSADDVLGAADRAMYVAKQRGKGCWEFAADANDDRIAS